MPLETNHRETQLKENITKEFDAIIVPEGFKEELWSQIKPKRKKRIFSPKMVPYIVAAAAIAIFIPLVLSILSTTDMANNELADKTLEMRVPGDPNTAGDFQTIETFVFPNGNTFINKKGNIEGTYELTDDKLVLLIEDENEKLEIEYLLEETDRVVNGHNANIIDVNYEVEDEEQVKKYWQFFMNLYQFSNVLLSEK